jgi:hypothetical protein
MMGLWRVVPRIWVMVALAGILSIAAAAQPAGEEGAAIDNLAQATSTPPPLPGGPAKGGPPPLPQASGPVLPPPLPQSGPPLGAPPALPPRAADSSPAPSDLLRLVRHDFQDINGFGQPVEAYSMLLPHDWRVSGEVRWTGGPGTPPCTATRDAQLYLEAESPDGLWGLYILPAPKVDWLEVQETATPLVPGMPPASTYFAPALEQAMQAAHRPGSVCRVTANTSAEGLAEEAFLPAMRPGARIVGREDQPELRRQLQEQMAPTQVQLDGMMTGAFAASYSIAFETPAGPVEEDHLFMAWGLLSQVPLAGGGSFSTVEIIGLPVFASRYPAGHSRDDARAILGTIAATLRSNPRWDAAMAAHRAEQTRTAIAGARDRSRIWAETSREISEMQMEGWRNRQESADRMMALTSDQIREVQPLRDPATGRDYELPNHYSSFYTNPQGEILMSTDPTFRANDLFPHESWTRLEDNPR